MVSRTRKYPNHKKVKVLELNKLNLLIIKLVFMHCQRQNKTSLPNWGESRKNLEKKQREHMDHDYAQAALHDEHMRGVELFN